MHLTAITYQRVKNLGNYESERFEATAHVDEGEDPDGAYEALKAYVERHLGIIKESDRAIDDLDF